MSNLPALFSDEPPEPEIVKFYVGFKVFDFRRWTFEEQTIIDNDTGEITVETVLVFRA